MLALVTGHRCYNPIICLACAKMVHPAHISDASPEIPESSMPSSSNTLAFLTSVLRREHGQYHHAHLPLGSCVPAAASDIRPISHRLSSVVALVTSCLKLCVTILLRMVRLWCDLAQVAITSPAKSLKGMISTWVCGTLRDFSERPCLYMLG